MGGASIPDCMRMEHAKHRSTSGIAGWRSCERASPAETDTAVKPWRNFGEMRQFFDRVREQIGETRYFEELELAGVQNPGQFKTSEKALECYARLLRLAKKEVA